MGGVQLMIKLSCHSLSTLSIYPQHKSHPCPSPLAFVRYGVQTTLNYYPHTSYFHIAPSARTSWMTYQSRAWGQPILVVKQINELLNPFPVEGHTKSWVVRFLSAFCTEGIIACRWDQGMSRKCDREVWRLWCGSLVAIRLGLILCSRCCGMLGLVLALLNRVDKRCVEAACLPLLSSSAFLSPCSSIAHIPSSQVVSKVIIPFAIARLR